MNIMSLEIQRMPKGNEKFGNASKYPYFSVCSPSCHDMSTIRGWWQADHENAKDFYYNYLHGFGLTPMDCLPDIVQAILDDHLSSPSMLCIVPLQDWLALDKNLNANANSKNPRVTFTAFNHPPDYSSVESSSTPGNTSPG